jgi:ketosteroid isomerase-like protein
MPAYRPEEICALFREAMGRGDLEGVLSLYDPEAVFLNQSCHATGSREELRAELTPLVDAKAVFDYTIKQVVQAGDIALMHTLWEVSGPQQMSVYAIEVARREADGTWRWLIGDPFTVGRP